MLSSVQAHLQTKNVEKTLETLQQTKKHKSRHNRDNVNLKNCLTALIALFFHSSVPDIKNVNIFPRGLDS